MQNNRPDHDGCELASHELGSSGDKAECLPWRGTMNLETTPMGPSRTHVFKSTALLAGCPENLEMRGSECTVSQHEDQYPSKKPL